MSGIPSAAVRIARDRDLEDLARLRWLWEAEVGDVAGDQTSFISAAVDWARAHRHTHVPHIAVVDERAVIGMAWLALTARVATTRNLDRWSGDLQSCYILPEYRGAGIGSRLVQAVLTTAEERGVEHVTVHTTPDAADMYERQGFRTNPRLLWADVSVRER